MKHFHKNPKWPWLGTALFEHSRALILATGKPFIMENVRCAERFIGRSVNHCGPFYFWGNGTPAIMPGDLFRIRKGFNIGGALIKKEMPLEERRKIRANLGSIYNTSSGSAERLAATSEMAEIPFAISEYIAQAALNML